MTMTQEAGDAACHQTGVAGYGRGVGGCTVTTFKQIQNKSNSKVKNYIYSKLCSVRRVTVLVWLTLFTVFSWEND